VALAPTHAPVVQDRDRELAGQRRTWNRSVLLAEYPGPLDYVGEF
jgi:hypothetical protein